MLCHKLCHPVHRAVWVLSDTRRQICFHSILPGSSHLRLCHSSSSVFASLNNIKESDVPMCLMLSMMLCCGQVYKFLYASRLLDCGLASQAFHYCEVVGQAILRLKEPLFVLTGEVIKVSTHVPTQTHIYLSCRTPSAVVIEVSWWSSVCVFPVCVFASSAGRQAATHRGSVQWSSGGWSWAGARLADTAACQAPRFTGEGSTHVVYLLVICEKKPLYLSCISFSICLSHWSKIVTLFTF